MKLCEDEHYYLIFIHSIDSINYINETNAIYDCPDKAGVMSVTLTSSPGGPGPHIQAGHQQLHLVDPGIQLHQQE